MATTIAELLDLNKSLEEVHIRAEYSKVMLLINTEDKDCIKVTISDLYKERAAYLSYEPSEPAELFLDDIKIALRDFTGNQYLFGV